MSQRKENIRSLYTEWKDPEITNIRESELSLQIVINIYLLLFEEGRENTVSLIFEMKNDVLDIINTAKRFSKTIFQIGESLEGSRLYDFEGPPRDEGRDGEYPQFHRN